MSNQALIQFVKFTPLDSNLEVIESNYGFVICDDFESHDQVIGSKKQMMSMLNYFGKNPLTRALGIITAFTNSVAESILEFAQTQTRGIYVDGNYYSAEEITKALADVERKLMAYEKQK